MELRAHLPQRLAGRDGNAFANYFSTARRAAQALAAYAGNFATERRWGRSRAH